MGVIGLSYDDFCRLTPAQFNHTCKAFTETQITYSQADWERSRMTAFYAAMGSHLDPRRLKRMTPQKLMPFTWDNKIKRSGNKKPVKGDRERMKLMFEQHGSTYKVEK